MIYCHSQNNKGAAKTAKTGTPIVAHKKFEKIYT